MSVRPTNGKALRFAALVRVSTERQEKQGESLRTQAGQLEQAAASLGGKIVQRYVGQEHATAGHERQLLDQLLADAVKPSRPFDAVMVADPSRWSRDNVKSETGLEVLRDAGVRFYVLTTAYDLFDPQPRLFLALSSTIGAFHARVQKQKSLQNRIERARRGLPATGRMPTGRTFDQETGEWGVDPDEQAKIAEIAKRYLAGEALVKLAKEYGLTMTNLYDTLGKRCGETWVQRFRAADLNIDEEVVTKVPRLLPDETIKAVCQRLKGNRTCRHRLPRSVHDYLLGGHIFCDGCGYAMTGQEVRATGILYYRHPHKRNRKCPLKHRPWVRADKIEAAVVRQLFETLGNPAAIERAVKAAVPDCEEALKRRERVEGELTKIDKARNRVLGLIEKDALTDAQAEAKLRELKDREAGLRTELDQLTTTLANVPDTKAIRLFVEQIEGSIFVMDDECNTYAGGNDVQSFLMMTSEDRRALVRAALSGTVADPEHPERLLPAGVYVSPDGETRPRCPSKWTFTLLGRLVTNSAGH